MLDAYLYEGVRTPFGRHGGTLARVRPDDLPCSSAIAQAAWVRWCMPRMQLPRERVMCSSPAA